MDKKTIGILILSMTAAFLLALSITTQPTAEAAAVIMGRDYQAVTARAQQGGDALYILDNKTGQMAVFLYNSRDKAVRVRAVRMVSDAFGR